MVAPKAGKAVLPTMSKRATARSPMALAARQTLSVYTLRTKKAADYVIQSM